MSIAEQILALEDLAAIDAALKILDDQLASERATLGGMKQSLQALREKLEVDRGALAETEKTRGSVHTDVRTMTQQLEHSRDKMNRSRTERETNAVQREIEELRKLIRDREDEAEKLAADAEGVRTQIAAAEAEAAKIEQELSANEGDISSRVGQVEAQRTERLAQREGATKRLPPQLFRRYEHIRSKRGSAVAATTDGTCKACNMSLPPQLFHRLRREPMIDQCPSCNRLIYFSAPAAAPTE